MDPPDRVGAELGGAWTLDAVLGHGGTGTVYRARHRDGRVAAVKVLHARLAGERGLVARFGREATLANKVDHPGVARVLEAGTTDDGCPYLVSELVIGETLEAERVRRGGALPAGEVKAIGGELLAILAAAHARGVLHRDVKPQNVVRAEGGDLKVLDFGLARESEGSGEGVTSLDAVLGTVGFMAPEQAQGRWDLVDEATDVWAVGATLLKLATGLDAHEGATPQERLAFAATRPVPRVASRAPDLDPALADVIDRAMAYSRKERFASAEVMRRALDGVAHVESPASSAVAGSSSASASSPVAGSSSASASSAVAGSSSASASSPVAGSSSASASSPVAGSSSASASSPVAGSSSASAPAPREPAVAGRRLGVLPIVAVVLALALAAGYAATRPPPPLPSAPLAASTPPLLTSSPPAALTSAPTARAPVALSTGAPSAAALSPGLRAAPSLGRSAEAPVSAAPPSAAAPASVAPSTDPLDRRR